MISPFQTGVNIVARRGERGHTDKMAHHTAPAAISTRFPEEPVPVAMPNWYYLHIHNDVILWHWKQHGVTRQRRTPCSSTRAASSRRQAAISETARRANASVGLALRIYRLLIDAYPIHGETSVDIDEQALDMVTCQNWARRRSAHRQRGPCGKPRPAEFNASPPLDTLAVTARGPRRSMALKYLLDTSVIKRPAGRRAAAVEPLAEAGAVARSK